VAAPPVAPDGGREAGDSDMSHTYLTVVVVWVLVLAALFAFQQYFTH
jgi:hypothetical protein